MLKHIRNLTRRLLFSDDTPDLDQERLYADARSCAISILSTEAVQGVYQTLGGDPKLIKIRLDSLGDQDVSPDVDQLLRAGSLWGRNMASLAPPVPLELCRLIGLLVYANAGVKEALTPPNGKPGDIAFYVAHKQLETALRSKWPTADEQTGKLMLLNDSFSPMEFVVEALKTSFGMDRELAIKKMLEVHKRGEAALEVKGSTNAAEACCRLNSEWRSLGLALYCVPQRRPS